jgi:ATP-dependent DNA helicase Rep
MSTYSSLGLRILKEEIGKLRRDSNFVVIDEQEQSEIILSLKKKMNAGLEKKLSKSPRVILGIISGIYSGFFDNVYEEEFNSILSNKKFWLPFMLNEEEKKQIFDIFIQYHETKKNNNYVDYDDLLSLPLLIFKKNKDVVEK